MQASVIAFTVILLFVLASGLVVLWRRGAGDLDAWGLFVVRVLRGDPRNTNKRTNADLPATGDSDGPLPRRSDVD